MLRVVALVLAVGAGACTREEPDFSAAERLAMQQESGGLDPWSETAFGYADDDQDGKVGLDQYKSSAMRFFARQDKNGDMVLDPEERYRRPGEPPPQKPRPRLTAEEFNAGLERRFKVADVDQDGFLTRAEWGSLPRVDAQGAGPPKTERTES